MPSALYAPHELDAVPALQLVHQESELAAHSAENVPGGHAVHTEEFIAPTMVEYVPCFARVRI